MANPKAPAVPTPTTVPSPTAAPVAAMPDPAVIVGYLKMFLPFMEMMAKITKNPYDDLAVAYLKAFLNNDELVKSTFDTLKANGEL